ncbi:hypothetical protein GCM10029976_098820 [Kribbella albertanoniae]
MSTVTETDWNDDGQLLEALRDALVTEQEVPRAFVEAGKAAFAWRTIDAELAALTYDSAWAGPRGGLGPLGRERDVAGADVRFGRLDDRDRAHLGGSARPAGSTRGR